MQLNLKKSLARNQIIIYLWLLGILGLAILAILYPKGSLNLFFSANYDFNVGQFFRYYTHLGEELYLLPLALILFVVYRNKKFTIQLVLSMLLNSILTLPIKYILIQSERPKLFLSKYTLIFTEGVEVHQYNSFPSGHTSAAFAFAFALVFWINDKKIGVLLIFMAFLVGMSRIYLQQHFIEDVISGSVLGFCAALASLAITGKLVHD
ncbi:MAG: phosphatase PAP2 family protein [Flavobacteriales bacterium]|nr:phosphatase PAP2 family protein [Flavobacteriales bacterium]